MTANPKKNGLIECQGWWNQNGLGDQPMQPLKISIDSGKIEGYGHDIVGMFSLTGFITESNAVHIVKTYAGKHNVDYYGTYDKKGTLYGQWELEGLSGFWEIRFFQERKKTNVVLRQSMPRKTPAPDRQLAI